ARLRRGKLRDRRNARCVRGRQARRTIGNMTPSPVLLHDLLRGSEEFGDRSAIVHGDRTCTYGVLARAVEALAGRLAACGLQRGDRVAIHLPKSLDECVAIFATSRASGVFVPINASLKPP